MSQHHNYVNPAFCQQSEFYETNTASNPPQCASNGGRPRVHRSLSMRSARVQQHHHQSDHLQLQHLNRAQYNDTFRTQSEHKPPAAASRYATTIAQPTFAARHVQTNLTARYDAQSSSTAATTNNNHILASSFSATDDSNASDLDGGFALVPLSELPRRDRFGSRYAVVPAQQAMSMRSVSQLLFARSQDDLDRSDVASLSSQLTTTTTSATTPTKPNAYQQRQQHQQHSQQQPQQPHTPRMHTSTRYNSTSSMYFNNNNHNKTESPNVSIQSTPGNRSASNANAGGPSLSNVADFVHNKSLILVDQKSQQRYAIVPTADDEQNVDANSEIIQIQNGRAHRYAVIPTDYDSGDDDGSSGVVGGQMRNEAHDNATNNMQQNRRRRADARMMTEDEDEEDGAIAETCLSSGDFEMSPLHDKYATIKCAPPGYHQSQLSLIMQQQQQQLQRSAQSSNNTHGRVANQQHHQPITPSKCTPNSRQKHEATQKMFELLSTPRKMTASTTNLSRTTSQYLQQQQQQQNSSVASTHYATAAQQPQQYIQHSQTHYPSTHMTTTGNHSQHHLMRQQQPQSLPPSVPQSHYNVAEHAAAAANGANGRQHHGRQTTASATTTAVITPRLARSNKKGGSRRSQHQPSGVNRPHVIDVADDDDDDADDDDCASDSQLSYDDDGDDDGNVGRRKHATTMETDSMRMRPTTATMGAVSLMLMLCGAMNSALCMYMITVVSLDEKAEYLMCSA